MGRALQGDNSMHEPFRKISASDSGPVIYSVAKRKLLACERGSMHVHQTLSAPRITLGSLLGVSALALSLAVSGCKSAPPAAPVDDASLTAAVQTRIAADSSLGNGSINSSVQSGIATLNGNVATDAARSQAAADAAQVAGVRTVVNNLIVQAPPPPPPTVAAVTAPPPRAVAPKKSPVSKLKPAPVVRQAPEPAPPVAAPPPPQMTSAPPPSFPEKTSPPVPQGPAFRNITLPADTVIPVRITQTLDSASTQQGDTFTGTVATDIYIDGLVVIPQGTTVSGRVSAVQEAAHYKGNSLLTVELTGINRKGERLAITTDPYSVKGKGRGKNTAEKVGGGAAVGAILGGIFGGGSGAAIGAAAGGGLGAGANTVTRGQQVQIPSESLIRFHLTNTLSLKVPTRDTGSSTGNPDLQSRPANQPPQ